MFSLLYGHTDDSIFDDFPKISNHFLEIFQNCSEGQMNIPKHFLKIFKDYQRLLKTFKEDPKIFWSYTNKVKYNLRNLISVKSSISSLVRIWKIHHSSPGWSFVWILRVVYFPVKNLCLYDNKQYYWMRLSIISWIIKTEVCVICQSQRLRQIIQTRRFDNSWYHAKTEFNNYCLLSYRHKF